MVIKDLLYSVTVTTFGDLFIVEIKTKTNTKLTSYIIFGYVRMKSKGRCFKIKLLKVIYGLSVQNNHDEYSTVEVF
jgi:hypothetical protein